MTTQITTTEFAGANEAVRHLHALVVTARESVIACNDRIEINTLAREWDYAELNLTRATAELLAVTIDDVEPAHPVAWTHRRSIIAGLANTTEEYVHEVCVTYDWGMGMTDQIASVNRMTNAEIADWVRDVITYELI